MKNQELKWLIASLFLLILNVSHVQGEPQLLHANVVGKGKPMILIHGMACDSSVWNDFVERYASKYEIHLVSIPGFGNKSEVESENILAQLKSDLISYTQSNNLKKPILVGHSMGGFLSLWAASEESNLFDKIISIDGIPYFPVMQVPGITAESAKTMASQMASAMSSMNADQALSNQRMIVENMIATESKRNSVVEMGMNSNSKVIGQAFGEMFTTDIRNQVEKIKIPVLVFGSWAAYQKFGVTEEVVKANYLSQLEPIENVEFKLAKSAYHFVFFDEPEWFYASVDAFLDKK